MFGSSKAAPKPSYYCLDVAGIPEDEYTPEATVESWLQRCTTAGPDGFGADSFSKVSELPTSILLERTLGIPFYFLLNVLPFLLPLAWYTGTLWLLALYLGPLTVGFFACAMLIPRPKLGKGIEALQYAYTERNISRYLSLKMVWPAALHYPAKADSPMLFTLIPHGFAPLGVTCYAVWSKVFGRRLTRWTAAPFVMKIPMVGAGLRAVGYLPAKAKNIEEALVKKEHSVGLILDGIAGMFQVDENVEKAYVAQRKGIVKVALRAGAPIVPVYAFGHTSIFRVLADPFGLLQRLSIRLDVSLVVGLGRWGWPLGPPRRTPVVLALGEPIECPKTAEPSQELVDEYHAKMCAGFQQVFDAHKAAYGWRHKELRFV